MAKEAIKRRRAQEEAEATALLANTVHALERSASFIASSPVRFAEAGSELVMAGLEKGGSITHNVAGSAKNLLEKGGSITNNVVMAGLEKGGSITNNMAGSAKNMLEKGGSSAKNILHAGGSGSFDARLVRSGSFMGEQAQKPSVFGKLFRSQTSSEFSARRTGDDKDCATSGHGDLVETELDSNELIAGA